MTYGEILDAYRCQSALVIGDLMLDEYIFGRATRISPEAPVMVVRHQSTTRLPGGAANVARNILAFGAHVHLLGIVGDDESGRLLGASLEAQGLGDVSLVTEAGRVTTRKTRVLADHRHQVIRVDDEDDRPLSEATEAQMIELALRRVPLADVVVLSDYLKGSISPRLAEAVIGEAKEARVPVVVNPKPTSLPSYNGATLISLNKSEASAALPGADLRPETAAEHASALRDRLGVESVLITMGEAGMAAAGEESFFVTAPRVEVSDPAGAGDTVVASVALGIAACGWRREIFEVAAQAAAAVVRHVAVATPSADDLQAIRALPQVS